MQGGPSKTLVTAPKQGFSVCGMGINDEIGQRIREAREQVKIDGQKMTQAELGQKFGYTSQTVSHWETGTHPPNVADLVNLADILNVSVAWLLLGPASNSLDADLFLVPPDDREYAEAQARRVISKWINKD